MTEQVAITILIFLTLINCGAIMEQKQWVFYLEFVRLIVAAIGILALYPGLVTVTMFILATSLLIYYFNAVSNYYLRLIYKTPETYYQ